jgi:hypothetical protein
MAEEWRVSLVIDGRGGTIRGSYYRDLLRNRLGDDVTVSAGTMHIFLYTGSAKAADEAGQVARAVLEEQGRRIAEVRLERWDPAGEEWRDPAEPPAEPDDKPESGRLETTVTAFVKGVGQALQWGSP